MGLMNRDLMKMLAPWFVAGVVDVYVALGGWPRHSWGQQLFEIGFLTLAGWAQWRFARGWLRTPLLAPVVMVFYAAITHMPETAPQIAAYVLGWAAGLYWLLRLVSARFQPSYVVGIALAVLVVIGSRYVEAISHERPRGTAARSILSDLMWPVWRIQWGADSSDGPPIVVISVDTLRTDAAASMETVRRLRERGAYWERAMSTSNWTLPALASLQTGLMPAIHGAGCLTGRHCQGVYDHVPMIAEQLRAAGYVTAASVSNPWVTGGTGLDRGFGRFIESGNFPNRLLIGGLPSGPEAQDAQHVVDAALDWLAVAPERGFYLWVHVLDPHLPYRHAADPWLQWLSSQELRTAPPPTAEQERAIRAAYANEVAYVDQHLLRLLEELDRRGVLDAGVVVFTADHGEEFWEHGGIEHGHTHYTEVVDVPLAIVAPGLAPGLRSEGVASLADVAPTLRAFAGLEPAGLDLREGIAPNRIATAWGGIVMHIDCSARGRQTRAIVRDCSDSPAASQVFDLQVDPGELEPLPPTANSEVVSAARAVVAPEKGLESAAVNREALRALGYMPE